MTAAIPIPPGSGYTLDNLPFGVFAAEDGSRIGVAVGEVVIDLREAAADGLVPHRDALSAATLDPFLALPPEVWRETRAALRALAGEQADRLSAAALRPRAGLEMLLPFTTGDFVDFYSSRQHATNLGRLFRPGADPLHPNWVHLPVGYHGRGGTVVVSGTPIARPRGPVGPGSGAIPTTALDFELEVGFLVGGPGNRRGEPIAVSDAGEHIFGAVLVNDWSARDIQRWEYTPLGPFLGKSFATSVSPWVVPLEALRPYLVPGPVQDPPPAEYLRGDGGWGLDLDLEVALHTAVGAEAILTRVGFAGMYWTMAQQLAHLTINGATVRPGDLFASGTVSGEEPGSWGSLVEITANGSEPVLLPDGETRAFLADGDTVIIRGRCHRPGKPRLDFGECVGTVLPAPAVPR